MNNTKPINDGGPAFPGFQYEPGCGATKTTFGPNGEAHAEVYDPGMSIRDYFAAKAMAGILAGWSVADKEIPRLSYELADAMLAKRAKGAK